LDDYGEDRPFNAASLDTVVCAFTHCSAHSPLAALAGARRVAMPGGRFLSSEHGLARDPKIQHWPQRIKPLWKSLAGVIWRTP
jgi:ubiquinone/menaquinone biosynthesis C-methylase UbiE